MACISFRATRHSTVNPIWVLSGRTELSHPLPPSLLLHIRPLQAPSASLCLTAFRIYCKVHVVSSSLSSSVLCLISFRIPSYLSARGLLEQISFVLSCYPQSPISSSILLPEWFLSNCSRVFLPHLSTVMFSSLELIFYQNLPLVREIEGEDF
jgi:hypothetical protein